MTLEGKRESLDRARAEAVKAAEEMRAERDALLKAAEEMREQKLQEREGQLNEALARVSLATAAQLQEREKLLKEALARVSLATATQLQEREGQLKEALARLDREESKRLNTIDAALEERGFFQKDRDVEASRGFAVLYLKAVAPSSRGGVAGATGGNILAKNQNMHPGCAPGLAEELGFPHGGLGALRSDRKQVPQAPPSDSDRKRHEYWWQEWASECQVDHHRHVKRGEGGSHWQKDVRCFESYITHFMDGEKDWGKHPPRFRPDLRVKRRATEQEHAEEATPQEVSGEPKEDRFHVPTQNLKHGAKNESADQAQSGNLGEQVDAVMNLEDMSTEDVTVIARVRPMLPKEKEREEKNGVTTQGRLVQIDGGSAGPGRQFPFDAVVGQNQPEGTDKVFEQTGKLAAKEVARGVSAVVFAFGQTGSGKTYTLLGDKEQNGIALMSFKALSDELQEKAEKEAGVGDSPTVRYTLECSILQVYRGGVYDLLSDNPDAHLRVRAFKQERSATEKGGHMCELHPREKSVRCIYDKDFAEVLERGLARRVVRGTNMNDTSSRSHCIITILVKRTVLWEGPGETEVGDLREHTARLIMVDLAGNERDSARTKKHENSGNPKSERSGTGDDEDVLRAEGIDVNKSLTALSSVLRLRSEGKSAVGTFRESALTRLLQKSLTSAKIFFIACVSPLQSLRHSSEHTLEYAGLVKKIKTDAESCRLLFEETLNKFAIEFLPHTSLVKNGSIPKSDERLTVFLNELRADVVRIFVSHRWLSPSANKSEAHPDDQHSNPKHALICSAVQTVFGCGWIKCNDLVDVVNRVDFACINQDSPNPAAQLNDSMGRIIGACDLMITPVHDPGWQMWTQESGVKALNVVDAFNHYRAEPFQEYLKRGWCRLEMFFNANMPFDTNRQKHFGGKLLDVMSSEKRRPHLVYGTRELQKGLEPIILPKLEDELFETYHPGKGELFDKEKDQPVINSHVEHLFKINAKFSGKDAAQVSPSGLSYDMRVGYKPTGEAVVLVVDHDDIEIAPATTFQPGEPPATISVSPALPEGISLFGAPGENSGIIRCKPATQSQRNSYSVVATNPAGSCSFVLTLEVQVHEPPTSRLNYGDKVTTGMFELHQIFPCGLQMNLGPPEMNTGTYLTYTVSPALPPGISIDPANGGIAGTPTASTTRTKYEVGASNARGQCSTWIEFSTVEGIEALENATMNKHLYDPQKNAFVDPMNKTTAAVEGLFNECNMSQVSERQHGEFFTWKFCGEQPMVSEDDKRVAGLADTLTKCRDVNGFSKSNGKLCRENAVHPFFMEFAKCTGVAMTVADEVQYGLRVNVGGTSFRGLTDILLGPKAGCPQLVIEVKPMAGISSLAGKQFSDLAFRTKTQVVLQCAAFQSLYMNSGNPFSCVLTDLQTMYVVQVESYNSNTICANIFRAVTEPNDFVRALLHASDSNTLIPKRANDLRDPIVCFTSEGFDSTRPDC